MDEPESSPGNAVDGSGKTQEPPVRARDLREAVAGITTDLEALGVSRLHLIDVRDDEGEWTLDIVLEPSDRRPFDLVDLVDLRMRLSEVFGYPATVTLRAGLDRGLAARLDEKGVRLL